MTFVIVGIAKYVNAFVDVPVPLGVVTTTSPAPAVPAAVTAVICVALSTVKEAAPVPAMDSAVAPVKSVPLMTTVVPPRSVPEVGLTPEIWGGFRGMSGEELLE